MPNDTAGYAFLPWFRRGIINQASAESVSANGTVQINLALQAVGEGAAPVTVNQSLRVYGPGEVTGVDRQAIVRTIPLDGVTSFEYNYLCGIEFYDEDFPWRYTPALPAQGQLNPWLWLVVLKATEFSRIGATPAGLHSIDINADALALVFPEADSIPSWAHGHLNFMPQGPGAEAWQTDVQTRLESNPNLGCSRLLCPRRLEPDTDYTAFLIPAFEKGRLAGLGKTAAEIDAATNAQLSWSQPEVTVLMPVYLEWSFSTSDDGDFETLARLIKPLDNAGNAALTAAKKFMDIRNPGWGLHYGGTPGSVPFASALQPYWQPDDPLLSDSTATTDKAFTGAVATLINYNANPVVAGQASGQTANPFFSGSHWEDDPLILPPLYGSYYRQAPAAVSSAKPGIVNNISPVGDWFNQLNLNPSMRLAAGQGTTVVQQDQEDYLNRAWDQLNQSADLGRLVRRWNYSLAVSQSFFQKRFAPVLQSTVNAAGNADTFLTLAFIAPMQKSLRAGAGSLGATLAKKFMPSAYSPSFTKLIRAGAPVSRRLNKKPASGIFFVGILWTPPKADVLYPTIGDILTYFLRLRKAGHGPVIGHGPVTHGPLLGTAQKDAFLKDAGLGGFAACEQALQGLQPYTQNIGIIIDPIPAGNGTLYGTLAAQLDPSVTLVARLQGILPSATVTMATSLTVAETPQTIEFPEAMYAPLAAISPDYILPGLEALPDNRVTLLKMNAAFIESYLTGLNHEMSREFLWRELPIPLNLTPFRQFWEVRDNPQATANPDAWKDIQAISDWGTDALGSHHPASAIASDLVILLRADLLKKYPNTDIFLQQAQWTDIQKKSRVPVATTDDSSVRRPLFSAQIDAYRFIGFGLSATDALGDSNNPGWFFVLKQRAGELHFGLDTDAGTDPSWPVVETETLAGHCLDSNGSKFKTLPHYTGSRADQIASLLYQRPFMLFIHVSQMLPKP